MRLVPSTAVAPALACVTILAGVLVPSADAAAPQPHLLVTTRVASAVTAVELFPARVRQVAWAAPTGQEAGTAGGVHLTEPSWVPGAPAFVVGWNHDVAGVVDRAELRRVDLRTGGVSTLVALTGRGELTEVAVAPDGRRIAFGLRTDDDPAAGLDPGRVGSTQQLWVVALGGGAPQPVAANPQENATDLAWSKDSRALAWVERAGVPGLYVARAPGTGEVLAPLGPPDLLVRRPVWLPSGEAVVVQGTLLEDTARGIGPSTWLMPLHAPGAVRWLAPGHEPALSPDGRRLVVRTPAGLAVVSLANGRSSLVTHGADDHGASWSADGRWIAYARDAGDQLFRSGVRVVRPDGRHDRAVTGWQDAGTPVWRPGG